jgi:hypothetical protein
MKGHALGLPQRASLNLELSLLISLLVLVCVASLGWLGHGIANRYAEAAGALDIAGGVASGPTDGTSADNGDGSYDIGWNGGQPPFQVVRSPQPDLSNRVIIADGLPDRSYTVPETDLVDGDNYIGIIDSDGRQLEDDPIHITLPLPPLPLVCSAQGFTTSTEAWVEIPQTDGSVPRNPLVWIQLADYAAPPVGWPDTQVDPDTGELLTADALCAPCHGGAVLP